MNKILFFDIETEGNPEAIKFMPDVSAPANYKDPDKIEAYIEDKKQEQIERAALDADYGRIVAIGLKVNDSKIVSYTATKTSQLDEKEIIKIFWNFYASSYGMSCGYNIIGFDLPYLQRRSFALGIKPSMQPDLRRYQTNPTLDLMMVLYGWQNFKGLKFVAERYGLDNPLPELDGSLVKHMDDLTLEAYVENDVHLVYQLYQKMYGIYF